MASFCFQCNLDMTFGPYSDFNIVNYKSIELCEGCGPIIVKNGECVDPRCKDHAKPSESAQRVYEHGRRYMRARRGPLAPLYYLWDRVRGTPWEPGLMHEVRHWWHLRKVDMEPLPFLDVYEFGTIPDGQNTTARTDPSGQDDGRPQVTRVLRDQD